MPPARLFLLLLVGLAVGSAWLAWRQPESGDTPRDASGKPLPDYYLTELTLTHYGPDGVLQRTLKSERLKHLAAHGTTLQQPRLTLHNPTGSPWVITAESGRLPPDEEILELSGEVEISRLATPDNRPLRMETRNLRYHQTEGYAETDEAVTVTSEKDRIDAVGLKAWLTSPGHIQFLSQVRAHYEP